MEVATVTINDLEETAKQEADGCCDYKIKSQLIEVEYMLDGNFRYRLDKQIVDKQIVIYTLGMQ